MAATAPEEDGRRRNGGDSGGLSEWGSVVAVVAVVAVLAVDGPGGGLSPAQTHKRGSATQLHATQLKLEPPIRANEHERLLDQEDVHAMLFGHRVLSGVGDRHDQPKPVADWYITF